VRKKFPKRNPKNELEAFDAPLISAMSSSKYNNSLKLYVLTIELPWNFL